MALNFAHRGTVSEMLADPNKEIHDVIRYFGTRKKIFNVHFRNIRGHRNDFVEVYPDEGDVNMVKAIQTYREVGYEYMLMPDHVPTAANDPDGLQSFAFCYGYIRHGCDSVPRVMHDSLTHKEPLSGVGGRGSLFVLQGQTRIFLRAICTAPIRPVPNRIRADGSGVTTEI